MKGKPRLHPVLTSKLKLKQIYSISEHEGTGKVLRSPVLHFPSTSSNGCCWTQTLNLGMTRRVLYHCVAPTGLVLD